MLPEIHTPIPGPRSLEAATRLRRYESQNVTYIDPEYPIFWQRAEGVNVWDVDGNRFLDWTSAFGVASLGHTAPAIREAVMQQAGTLFHAMGDVHPTPLKAELCERLSAVTFERWGAGAARTILGNSGSDAVEAALKTALLATGKPGVIGFHGAYHGLGYGALALGGTPYFRQPFQAQLGEFGHFLPFPKQSSQSGESGESGQSEEIALEALEAAARRLVAAHPIGAILVEPIQGRGGEIVPPAGFLPLLRRLCDELGLLLILDEIYTGFNRTGTLFACEQGAVVPDLICLGKALTGGFPLSACVGREAVMEAWPLTHGEALHTSTFLGNPLGCAMALASLKEHEQPAVAAHVRERGEHLLAALRSISAPGVIREIRGRGLLAGVELALTGDEVNRLVKQALRDGLIWLQSGPAGDVLAFTPPFAIGDDEIAFTVGKLQEYLTSLPGSIS